MRFADRGFAQVAVPLSFVAVDVTADTGPQAVNVTACPRHIVAETDEIAKKSSWV